MPAGSEGIQIPVSLQVDASNYQSIIADLQKSVNKLAPDSGLFKGVNKELQRLLVEADAIAAAMKQGFQNPAQVDRFNERIKKLGINLQTTITELSRVKFEDINLDLVDKDQVDTLRQLEAALAGAQDKVNNFSTEKMREFYKGSVEMQEQFSSLELNIKTDSFDKALDKARQKIVKLRNEIESKKPSLQKKELDLNQKQELYNTASNLEDILNSTKQSSFRSVKRGDSNYGFGPNKKNLLLEQLEQIGIDSETIEKIRNEKKSELSQFWEEIKAQLQEKGILDKLKKEMNAAQAAFNKESAPVEKMSVDLQKAESLERTLEHLQQLQFNPDTQDGKAFEALKQAVLDYGKALEELKKQIADAQVPQEELSKSSQDLQDVDRSLAPEIAKIAEQKRADAAASREAEMSQQRLTNAIRQWFSFREVINLTKRAIKDAVTHIKELDATMTQIAVVTNMTQSDLWDQIGTYSAIAQQYGVTTNGVYQVSQLYYQQGKLNI